MGKVKNQLNKASYTEVEKESHARKKSRCNWCNWL